MQAVLDEVGERLLDGDESMIRIPDICESTGVNYGSVYHHFGSREGVIDAAYNMLFTRLALEDMKLLRMVNESSTTLDEYLANVSGLLGSFSFGTERVRRRSMRMRIVAASMTRPELRQFIGPTQQALTEELRRLIQDGQDRGWLRADVSSLSIAVALQAMLVGRVIDDVSPTSITAEEWAPLAAIFFKSLLTLN